MYSIQSSNSSLWNHDDNDDHYPRCCRQLSYISKYFSRLTKQNRLKFYKLLSHTCSCKVYALMSYFFKKKKVCRLHGPLVTYIKSIFYFANHKWKQRFCLLCLRALCFCMQTPNKTNNLIQLTLSRLLLPQKPNWPSSCKVMGKVVKMLEFLSTSRSSSSTVAATTTQLSLVNMIVVKKYSPYF